jgi:hypothetical protein
MKSSTPEPTQSHPPLGEKSPAKPADPGETWRPYPPNPLMEINGKGQLRTRAPLPPTR